MHYNIGIIGGGQLGAMMTTEAHKLGYTVAVLDPNPKCSASYVCDKLITGSFTDLNKLTELGNITDCLAYEFENVKGEILKELDNKFNIPQGINILLDSQDRLKEKMNANKYGLPTVKFCDCSSLLDLKNAITNIGYPCIYKTRREGYDGHGQVVLYSACDIEKVKPYLENNLGIIESKIDFDFECSVIVIRSKDKTITFPIGLNIHKDGILDITATPNPYLSKDLEYKIKDASINFMKNANYYGILTIEYFVKGDKFYFNEMAPRPHNSGHYTIEGCTTNQFKELDKFLLNLPLEEPKLISATCMKNILGRDLINLEKLKKIKNCNYHDYHKDSIKELRKLGHITYTNTTLDLFKEELKKQNIEE